MIELTEEMLGYLSTPKGPANPCVVATAAADGTPNAGYIGTVLAIDNATLAYRDRTGRDPLDHIEDNPKVVVLFRDDAENVGWKFRCTARVYREGSEFNDAMARLAQAGFPIDPAVRSAVVVLRIDQLLTLFGEVLQERTPCLQW